MVKEHFCGYCSIHLLRRKRKMAKATLKPSTASHT